MARLTVCVPPRTPPHSRRCRSHVLWGRVRELFIFVLSSMCLLCFSTMHSVSAIRGDLIGWSENSSLNITQPTKRDGKKWIETLSWEPRIFVYHNFLSADECLHLIHLGAPHMEKSTVVDSATGKSVGSQIRTSSGVFLRRRQDDVVRGIEDKIAAFSMIPADHGEGMQVLHYEVGQKYEAHYDYFHDSVNTQNGGQRVATALLYLSDVDEGGETVFPNTKVPEGRNQALYSPCAQRGIAHKPQRGDAILFWSLDTTGAQDPKSLHASCPVVRGNKWTATKWMRVAKRDE